jgi:hypothetical protein
VIACKKFEALANLEKMNFRSFHRQVAPWIGIALVLSAITGMAFRLGRSWFNINSNWSGFFLSLHSWGWLGDRFSLVALTILAIGVFLLLGSAVVMLWQTRKKLFRAPKAARLAHRLLGLALLLPLALSAITGVAYRVVELNDGSDETLDFLMDLHAGGWLGRGFSPYYVATLGLAVLLSSFSGWQLRRPKKN